MKLTTNILKIFGINELTIQDEVRPEFNEIDNTQFSYINTDSLDSEIYLGEERLSKIEKIINFICGTEFLIDQLGAPKSFNRTGRKILNM